MTQKGVGIFDHNVCIEIESLVYLFSVTLIALDDRDTPDFVRCIIGINKTSQTDTSRI